MKFDLVRPCKDCPFRSDRPGYIRPARVDEIVEAITTGQKTFSCHKTVDYSEGDGRDRSNTQHCAGALIFLEKLERPNQMMRIAERIGLYDHTRLDMDAPVFDSKEDMMDAQR